MRAPTLCLLLWLVASGPAASQYYWNFEQPEDFPDGWHGDTADFVVRDGALRLQASGAGHSHLYHAIEGLDSMKWSVEYHLQFSPSASNALDIHLLQSDLSSTPAWQYTLHIGEDGRQDRIRFMKYKAGVKQWEVASVDSSLSEIVHRGTLAVAHDNHEWKISFWSPDHPSPYTMAPIPDTLPAVEGYFGLSAHYTKTRRDKFNFLAIGIGDRPGDAVPPNIVAVQTWNSRTLEVSFNEPLDPNSVTPSTFTLISPHKIRSVEYVDQAAVIELEDTLRAGVQRVLYAHHLLDLSGNEQDRDSFEFYSIYTSPVSPYDIIFNEIMFDPSPAAGLPEAEYIELYNRSDKYLELSELYLSDDGHSTELPDDTIPPHSYLILTRPADSLSLAPFGRTVAVQRFPALQNEGEVLRLTDYLTRLIDQFEYTPRIHTTNGKKKGGWSIELTHPSRVCEGPSAWKSASNLTGGTPGTTNSMVSKPTVLLGPKLDYIVVKDPYSLRLSFDQKLRWPSPGWRENTALSSGTTIQSAAINPDDPSGIILTLHSPILPGQSYHLIRRGPVFNCISIPRDTLLKVPFAIGVRPDSGELLINELLFNPPPGGTDFVELINASDKVLDLSSLRLASFYPTDTVVRNIGLDLSLFPGSVLALSSDPLGLRTTYSPPDTARIVRMALPPMWNDEGHIALLSAHWGEVYILDSTYYTESMHNPNYTDVEGVSLERVDVTVPSGDRFNWQSGIPSTSYATPGYPNAAQIPNQEPPAQAAVWIEHPSFYPDREGEESQALIRYQLHGSAGTMACSIYEMGGRMIKIIRREEPIGHHGFMFWDGTDADNKPCNTGVYIILAEVFEAAEGNKKYKIPVLLKRNNGH